MKVAMIGATGFVGSGILSKSLSRGHEVTAIVTKPEKLPGHAKLTPVKGDVARRDELASVMASHEVVISAFNPGKDKDGEGTRSIIEASSSPAWNVVWRSAVQARARSRPASG